jgi:hypothetical protein
VNVDGERHTPGRDVNRGEDGNDARAIDFDFLRIRSNVLESFAADSPPAPRENASMAKSCKTSPPISNGLVIDADAAASGDF